MRDKFLEALTVCSEHKLYVFDQSAITKMFNQFIEGTISMEEMFRPLNLINSENITWIDCMRNLLTSQGV